MSIKNSIDIPLFLKCNLAMGVLIAIFFIGRGEVTSPLQYLNDYQKVIDFANHLYNLGEYKSAITEYKRALFLGGDTSQITLQLGRSYLLIGEYELVREWLEKVVSSRSHLTAGIETDTSFALIGIAWLEEKDIEKTQSAFSKIKDEQERNKLEAYCSELLSLRKKSPVIAGLSSAIMPGAGRIYSGRVGDGIFASFFTIGSALISYHYYQEKKEAAAIGFGALGILFYLGDIYGATKSANLYNQKAYKDELLNIKRNLNYLY